MPLTKAIPRAQVMMDFQVKTYQLGADPGGGGDSVSSQPPIEFNRRQEQLLNATQKLVYFYINFA